MYVYIYIYILYIYVYIYVYIYMYIYIYIYSTTRSMSYQVILRTLVGFQQTLCITFQLRRATDFPSFKE